MNFQKKLYKLRTERKISQQELATSLGFSKNSICAWEKGRAQPNIETLQKLADTFECSIDYLVGREDDFGNVNVVSNTGLSVHEEDMIRKLRALGPLQFKYIQSQIDALYDVEKESIKK